MAYYLALIGPNDEIEFNEVWDDEAQAKDRARVLECEAAGRVGNWSAYFGTESIEACMAREEAVKDTSLTPAEVDAIAAATTTDAVIGEPLVDDSIKALICTFCGAEYNPALDWCPKCLKRPEVSHG